LPWSAYSAAFQADVKAKFDRIKNDDPFDLSKPGRPLRKTTAKTVEEHARRFTAACLNNGTEIDELCRLSDILEPERFLKALRWLLMHRFKWKQGQPIPDTLIEQANTVRQHGRYRLRHDIEGLEGKERDIALRRIDDQMEQLKEITSRLGRRKKGFTDKNRQAMSQFDDLPNLIAFLTLPEILFTRARRAKRPTKKDALLMQSTIAIRILQEDPIRLGNLAILDWDKNFVRSSPRKGAPVRLVLSSEQTKNKVSHNDPLPADLIRWIEVFMSVYQPLLATDASGYLFPGQNGGVKHVHSVRQQIMNTVKREIGLTISPHQYRHLAAKITKFEDPTNMQAVSDVLHHKDPNTAPAAYFELDQAHALTRYQEYLETRADQRWSDFFVCEDEIEAECAVP
jgi:integrase